jgi:methionine-S-sulfoxide reductase
MKKMIWMSLFLSLSVFAKTEKTMTTKEQPQRTETAYLAGGCFWGMEELIRHLPGVVSTDVGYSGGDPNVTQYELVKTGTSRHSEAVKVVFEPKKLSYAALLEFFFRIHDPTTLNQQGNDKGSQYRSAIFFTTPEQQKTALLVREKTNVSGKWKNPVVTEVTAFSVFNNAEDYHQDYLTKNPTGYTCHWVRN